MHVGNTDCKLSMSLNSSNTLPVVKEVEEISVHLSIFISRFTLVLLRLLSADLILKCIA